MVRGDVNTLVPVDLSHAAGFQDRFSWALRGPSEHLAACGSYNGQNAEKVEAEDTLAIPGETVLRLREILGRGCVRYTFTCLVFVGAADRVILTTHSVI